MGKAMVIDQVPKRIKHLKFGCMDPSDLVKQGVLEVSTRDLYTFGGSERSPAENGALDRRMVRVYAMTLMFRVPQTKTHCVRLAARRWQIVWGTLVMSSSLSLLSMSAISNT